MTPTELATLLDNRNTQVNKIAKEQSDRFDAVVAANKVLQDLLDAGGGGITPAIEAAAAALGTSLDNLDAAIPDAPTPA